MNFFSSLWGTPKSNKSSSDQDESFRSLCDDIVKRYVYASNITRDQFSVGVALAAHVTSKDVIDQHLNEFLKVKSKGLLRDGNIEPLRLEGALLSFVAASHWSFVDLYIKDDQTRKNVAGCLAYALSDFKDLGILLHPTLLSAIDLSREEILRAYKPNDSSSVMQVGNVFAKMLREDGNISLCMLAAEWWAVAAGTVKPLLDEKFKRAA